MLVAFMGYGFFAAVDLSPKNLSHYLKSKYFNKGIFAEHARFKWFKYAPFHSVLTIIAKLDRIHLTSL